MTFCSFVRTNGVLKQDWNAATLLRSLACIAEGCPPSEIVFVKEMYSGLGQFELTGKHGDDVTN
jgi:hypothetical protein